MTMEGKLTAENTSARPDAAQGSGEAVASMGGHGGLGDLEGLAEGGDLEHVETGAQQQVGELDGLLLKLVRLPNGGGDGGDCDHGSGLLRRRGALTKGRGCFFAKRGGEVVVVVVLKVRRSSTTARSS